MILSDAPPLLHLLVLTNERKDRHSLHRGVFRRPICALLCLLLVEQVEQPLGGTEDAMSVAMSLARVLRVVIGRLRSGRYGRSSGDRREGTEHEQRTPHQPVFKGADQAGFQKRAVLDVFLRGAEGHYRYSSQ